MEAIIHGEAAAVPDPISHDIVLGGHQQPAPWVVASRQPVRPPIMCMHVHACVCICLHAPALCASPDHTPSHRDHPDRSLNHQLAARSEKIGKLTTWDDDGQIGRHHAMDRSRSERHGTTTARSEGNHLGNNRKKNGLGHPAAAVRRAAGLLRRRQGKRG